MKRRLPLFLAVMLGIVTAACFRGAHSQVGAPKADSGGGAKANEVALCGPGEPGERLVVYGRVLDMDGRPLPKAAMVAYNTDRDGLYNPRTARSRIPRIRGAMITDGNGGYRFRTVRPGGYPNSDMPAHVHIEIVAPAHHARHLEVWFEGDPRITDAKRAEAARSPGTVIVALAKEGAGRAARVDLRLEGN